ncbi:hypothetical protein SAMN05660653_01426 [Desulfonatronum thiosulfatophilum]|uniref:Uncharacterized protein n=1 Tax=Desulfonatronum thiosulfatophilum TaxID=617002 RepID=A0A1G6C9Q1_9BACT|nr:hypothetical protein [Desulfonatronum thiosulfatophilum]SDB29598.1 hypothetical protein SAMN05660653_01426 [Desulfonatronum thiosulfatophilum]
MIDKNSAIPSLLERLAKLPVGHCLEIRTYKRNRRILFRRDGEEDWSAFQDGFEKGVHEKVVTEKLRKLLQSLIRKEFPRSTKIRVYALGPCSLEGESKLSRKVL